MTRFVFICLGLLLGCPLLADTPDKITGFETGNLMEFSATAGLEDDGTDGSITAAARTGERGFRINDSGETAELSFAGGPNAGDIHVYSICFRVNDATPASEVPLIAVESSGDVEEWSIDLQTDGTIDLKDETGTVQISTTSTASDNTWHCLEAIIERTNTTASATLFMDGEEEGDDAAASYLTGADHFQFTGSSGITLDFDDLYVMKSVGGILGRCSVSAEQLCEVLWFGGGAASAVPDDDCAGGTGTSLDTGNWDDLSQMPVNVSTGASYTGGASTGCIITDDVGSGSCTGGPSGCEDVGTIWAVNWVLYAERSTGSPTSFTWYRGSNAEVVSGSLSLNTSPQFFFAAGKEDENTKVPDHTEYCVLGLSKDGGAQDLEAWEHWCYVVNLPPVVEAYVVGEKRGTESPGNINGELGR